MLTMIKHYFLNRQFCIMYYVHTIFIKKIHQVFNFQTLKTKSILTNTISIFRYIFTKL